MKKYRIIKVDPDGRIHIINDCAVVGLGEILTEMVLTNITLTKEGKIMTLK